MLYAEKLQISSSEKAFEKAISSGITGWKDS
jgi:hypothetical protein